MGVPRQWALLHTVFLANDLQAQSGLYSSQQALCAALVPLAALPPLSADLPLPISLKPGTLSGHLADHIATSLSLAGSFLSQKARSNSLILQTMESRGLPSSCHLPARPCSLSYRLSAHLLEAVCTCYLSLLTSLSLHNLRQTGLCPPPL